MIKFLWKLTVLGSIGGLLLMLTLLFGGMQLSAPQEASGMALSIGLAVIPYCLARAASEVRNLSPNNESP